MPARALTRYFVLSCVLLAACVATPQAATPPGKPAPSATPAATAAGSACRLLTPPPTAPAEPQGGTATSGTAIAVTAVVVPPGSTAPPMPPEPTLVPSPPLTNTALRYELVKALGDVSYCDPDDFPIARPGELERAQAWFAQAGADSEAVQTIVRERGLGDPHSLTPEQQLVVYRDYKKLRVIELEACNGGYAFQYATAANERVTGQVDAAGKITVLRREPWRIMCPICLARDTRIATPGGEVPVQSLRPGDDVWTLSAAGERVPGVVLRVAHVPVPATHLMVALRLADGRALLASPGHPTTDGRRVGQLRPGDTVGGVTVLSADLVPYDAGATYDILPSGPTGAYWANGVLLGSTLGP